MDIDDLEPARKENHIHLTTVGRKTGRLHTVELWFALAPGGVYLSHEGVVTDWMKNIRAQPRVSARIGRISFEADAEAVSGEKRDEGAKALYEKYYEPARKEVIDDWFSLSHVIRLRPVALQAGKRPTLSRGPRAPPK
jgi:deazaflavin-dependent oxidoreductase (nitroreductase family)